MNASNAAKGTPTSDLQAQIEALVAEDDVEGAMARIGLEPLTPEFAQWLGECVAPVMRDGHKLFLVLAHRAHLHGDFVNMQHYAQQALKHHPSDPYAQQVLCQLLLWDTQFKQGLEYYEVRFEAHGEFDARDWREFPAPRWAGESLTDKHLYLWTEQGVGDIFQFCAFLPWVMAQQPASVTFGTHAKLIPLLQRSFPQVRVESDSLAFERAMETMLHGNDVAQEMLQQKHAGNGGVKFDFAAPIGDLMVHALPQWIPAEKQHSYLKADPVRVAQLKQKYKMTDTVRNVGISWHTANVQNGVVRSIPLALWKMMLAFPNCRFYSLQHDIDDAALDAFCASSGCSILRPGFDVKEDMDGLAALIASMDEIITIDNSNAHLAGALGIPTTLLLPLGCNYRWPLLENDGTLWYESVRVMRQKRAFDWLSVISHASFELGERLP